MREHDSPLLQGHRCPRNLCRGNWLLVEERPAVPPPWKDNGLVKFRVVCRQCGCFGFSGNSIDEAVSLWRERGSATMESNQI
jgi:hypothetical protein